MRLLITHSDLDMVGILVLTIYYNIEYNEIMMINYNEEDYKKTLDKIPLYDEIIYADFSPDVKSMDLLEKLNKKVYIYDHHDTAYQRLRDWSYSNKEYYYDDIISGTELYYKYCINPKEKNNVIEEFVNLVSVFDTGKKKSDSYSKACNLNRYLYQTKKWNSEGIEQYQFFINTITKKFDSFNSFEFTKWENGKIQEAISKEKLIFNEFINGKRQIKTRKDKVGRYFSIIKLTSKTNEICNMLLDKYKKLDYIIVINEYCKESLKISLRSRDTINLLEYENIGGHPNAAGFENISNKICNDLWDGKIYCLNHKENK